MGSGSLFPFRSLEAMPFAALDDPKQLLRLKRNLLALAGGAVHTILCWLLWEWNFFRATPHEFIGLFAFFWAVNLCWPLLIISGVNLRFKDPSMTLGQITWATITIMISLYFVYQMRMVVLMYYLLVMIFGAFQLRFKGFLWISALAIVGYGLVILLLTVNHQEIINPRVEYVQWLTFAVVMTCFSLVGSDLSALRRSHHQQNKQLAEALEQINRLVITDELTGVWNRRQMLQILAAQKALAERGDYQFTICFMDLDHFKRVNDRFGHSAGDLVLRKTATSLRRELREIDYLARFGGEEFVAVLAQTPLNVAWAPAERLRRGVQGLDFRELDSGLKITVSIGVAGYEPGESLDELLHRADQALYRAKDLGRNRVEFAPPSPPQPA